MAHGIAKDEATAARKSLTAGLGMDMATGIYLSQIPDLVKSGAVPMATLDDAVRRVLRLKLALGLFDDPYSDESTLPQASEGIELARTAAEESLVLLKNDARGRRAAAAARGGRGQDDRARRAARRRRRRDDGVLGLHRQARRTSSRCGARSRSGPPREKMTLLYAKGTDVRGEDRSGFARGGRGRQQGRRRRDHARRARGGDRRGLPRARASTSPRASRRCSRPWPPPASRSCSSSSTAARSRSTGPRSRSRRSSKPGTRANQAGPALVRTLFGDVNPSGHLTVSFPRAVGQEPLYYNALGTGRPAPPSLDLSKPPQGFAGRWFSRYIDEQNSPLFPFGHGLSYTEFQYSPVTVGAASISAAALNQRGATLTVSADVSNTGQARRHRRRAALHPPARDERRAPGARAAGFPARGAGSRRVAGGSSSRSRSRSCPSGTST